MSTFGNISNRINKVKSYFKPFSDDEVSVVDQYMAQDFCRSESGFIQSDLVSLFKAQNSQEQQLLLNRLVDLSSASDDFPADMSDNDKFALLRGRLTQSFSELDKFGNIVINSTFNKVKEQLLSNDSVDDSSRSDESASDSDKK